MATVEPHGVFLTPSEMTRARDWLSIPNPDKIKALKMGSMWAHRMPDTVCFAGKDGSIPMGAVGLKPESFTWTRKHDKVKIPEMQGSLNEEQKEKVNTLTSRVTGLMCASTGTGKTWMISGCIQKLSLKSLIVCHDVTSINQMAASIENIFGGTPRKVGGTQRKSYKVTLPQVTVAVINSAMKLSKAELSSFGAVFLDEVDVYLQSDKRRKFVKSLCPSHLYGFTGTPSLNGISSRVFDIFLGPKTELIRKNYTPTFTCIHTDFMTDVDGSKEFSKMKVGLYADEERNTLIADTVQKKVTSDTKAVVFTEGVEHANVLIKLLQERGFKVYLIIGKISGKQRESIRQEIISSKQGCVLVGSVKCIGRGFDIPELSMAFFTTAEKFQRNIEQYIGRVIRSYEGKEGVQYFDFVDYNNGILRSQAKKREKAYETAFPGCTIQHEGKPTMSLADIARRM